MILEQTLNGQYAGVFGEVVTEDCYRLRNLRFIPDLIIDIGGNIGIFSRFAHDLFPNSRIVAIEPHPANVEVFKDNMPGNTDLIQAAIGTGNIWHPNTAANGTGECYLPEGLGYPSHIMQESETIKLVSVATIMPDRIIENYWKPGMKTVVKIDCEGAENAIFEHEQSMAALRKMDYIAMEFHLYAQTHEEVKKVEKATMKAFKSFEATHSIEIRHREFFATKKVTLG